MNIATQIAAAAREVDRHPTEAQKKSGNYRKGHVRIHGMEIAIENPRGSFREGRGPDGKPWRSQLPHHYGYLNRTEGADGDHVDVFVGPHPKSQMVYVVDQHDAQSRKFDEHKSFIGFTSPQQVRRAYMAAFSDGKGKDRLGHLEEMTVSQFKDWLRNGDTTFPVKHRETGGRVAMADGGTPNPFDQFDEKQQTNTFDQFDGGTSQPTTPDEGTLHALGHGAYQGATMNFGDELRGVYAAGQSVPSFIPGARVMEGAARLARNWLVGGDPEALARYEQARDAERAAIASAKAHHPYAYTAGEIGGALPTMAALPETALARGTGLGARLAKGAVTGAEYGGISGLGEGEDMGQRVEQAGAGILGGGLGGLAGAGAGEVAGAAGKRFLGPAVSAVRGWTDPEAEAARRLTAAISADQQMISQGTAKGMPLADWVAAWRAGEPVTLADLGAGNVQSLLRSAANTSPEGRAMLEKVFEDRFLNQGERVASDVRNLVAGGANANKTAEDLVRDYNIGRKNLYNQAYSDGDNLINSPTMERLMGSPAFTAAMRKAVTTGQDRAISEGFGAFNPGVTIDPGGTIRFNRGATGAPQFPNLQYWDAVKRELDDMASSAFRRGEGGQGGVITNLRDTLRKELDRQVPSYKDARGFAADFFGSRDALQAGRDLAGKKVDPQVIRNAMKKMKPDEQELFREGYASDWSDRVINNISQTRDITKAMFNSPNEKARAEAVFGPAGMAKIQARMALETIMNGARNAMGNSTTARQLIEAGLAGGALEGYLSGWDPTHIGVGALSAAGARKALGTEMAAGARKLVGRVDAVTARNVARLLTSDNPSDLIKGINLAAKNQRVAQGLQRVANVVGLSAVAPAGRESGIRAVPAIQGAVGARAEDEKPKP